jgi:uncharacterized protein YbcC (UPF0753/DUF2309 family)
MHSIESGFEESEVLHLLKHYLPSQSPLKDFVHHNTLHAYQHHSFHLAMQEASEMMGYQVYLPLEDFRMLYYSGKIKDEILNRILIEKKGKERLEEWRNKLLVHPFETQKTQRIGALRNRWKVDYNINLSKYTQSILFRLIGNYLDQGISLDHFPRSEAGFLASIKALDKSSFVKIFKSKRVKQLLIQDEILMTDLLQILVGDEQYFIQYLFDQQFAHPGWSGMVSVLEGQPESLLDRRNIALKDFILLELLLEIETLDNKFGATWKPIAIQLTEDIEPLFMPVNYSELYEVYALFQEAYEWSYYDEVLKGMQLQTRPDAVSKKSFQAIFCIDDRECSFRRYIESKDAFCETFSTAGFFNVAFYFQPEHGKFYTKVCPAPQFPKHLIQEFEAEKRHQKNTHFNKHTHGFFGGMIMAPTMGFWSALKMVKGVFYPSQTDALISSFKHMDRNGKLVIEADTTENKYQELNLGFTTAEMVEKITGLLRGIGLVKDFAPLVYLIGHGASSVNNTHYAGYDCGACSGRAGSVNARVAAFMANLPKVREGLQAIGIHIPETTQFLGGLHDTTRDEMEFYDETELSSENQKLHLQNLLVFKESLSDNAKERSRRFLMIDSSVATQKVHQQVKLRSLSLFEPRPEWNHATNTLCIVGRRQNTKHLFLDRRAFLNSYDYTIDSDGTILLGILNAVAPVCGGINLEYYFSRVDNYRLGAGTKLPHNVMGLIGVANGMDGDLRTGLPKQMVNIHDPLRLMVIIEQIPDEVLRIIQLNTATYDWFLKEWIHLVVMHPEHKSLYVFKDGRFQGYQPLQQKIPVIQNLSEMLEKSAENLPVYQLN